MSMSAASMVASFFRFGKDLCLCHFSPSAPRGQTPPTSAPTRQLPPHLPPHLCPPTPPPQYLTGNSIFCFRNTTLSLKGNYFNYLFAFFSDSSSPNHQADPGSHGNSEVREAKVFTHLFLRKFKVWGYYESFKYSIHLLIRELFINFPI